MAVVGIAACHAIGGACGLAASQIASSQPTELAFADGAAAGGEEGAAGEGAPTGLVVDGAPALEAVRRAVAQQQSEPRQVVEPAAEGGAGSSSVAWDEAVRGRTERRMSADV